MEHGAHIGFFQLIGIPEEYSHVAGALLVALVLLALGFYVRAKLANLEKYIVPEPRVNLLNISESLVSAFRGLLHQMIGHGSDAYIPVIATTFLFILVSNLLGLIPGFEPPTANLSTNAAMALFIFFAYMFLGFKEHGFGYLKHFTGGLPPKGVSSTMAVFLSLVAGLVVVIEVFGNMIRPVSLSLRLWGNMMGDHTLLGVVTGLVPLVLPVVFMCLGVFVSVIQALVFSLLSSVYIKLAVSHDH